MHALMLIALGLLAAAGEPARLVRGDVPAPPYGARAAGLVAYDVTVDARGAVANVRPLRQLEPFSGPLEQAIAGWSFEAAREGGVAALGHVLVAGLYRPAALLFPAPTPPAAPPAGGGAAPVPRSVAVPPYPPNAMGDAQVLVEIEVGEDGGVVSTRVVGASSGFDGAALEAARGWRFTPALQAGRPVASRAYVVFGFRAPVTG
ncbi:MAG: energy transducer TonB [Vicinamibacteria bacterium]